MIIFAHRGASGDYPENTMLAFRKALEIGVDGIELDIHKCKDGELVVIHDEDIKRTFKGKGLVKDYTLEELREFNCKKFRYRNDSQCKICTLKEVIEIIKNEELILNIEAKTDIIHYNLEQDVLNLINEYDVKNKILISSFHHPTIKKLKNMDSDVMYGALYGYKPEVKIDSDIVDNAIKIGVYSINISKHLVSQEIVEMAHNSGIKVFVYTVNSSRDMKNMIKFEVDGVFTDYPEKMKKILQDNI